MLLPRSMCRVQWTVYVFGWQWARVSPGGQTVGGRRSQITMSCHVMGLGQVTELDQAHEAGLKLQEREPRLHFDQENFTSIQLCQAPCR
jgi:hypothetical protein